VVTVGIRGNAIDRWYVSRILGCPFVIEGKDERFDFGDALSMDKLSSLFDLRQRNSVCM
jgi:hypothetical protein